MWVRGRWLLVEGALLVVTKSEKERASTKPEEGASSVSRERVVVRKGM